MIKKHKIGHLSYPVFILKLKKNKKWGKVLRTSKIMRIFHLMNLTSFEKAYLKVIYAPGAINEGYYYNLPELKNAWTSFADTSLIREWCPSYKKV